MGDEAKDVGGTGTDPGTGSGSTTSESTSDVAVDLETVAAEFDAAALGESTTSGSEDGGATGEDGKPAGPNPLDLFIQQNYGGDEQAFLTAQYEQRSEQKRLTEELKELRGRIAPPAPRDVEAEIKASREADAEFQAIDQEIKNIDADTQQILASQKTIGIRAAELSGLIKGAAGKLVHADDVEKPGLIHDQTLWETELLNLSTEFNAIERARITNNSSRKILERDLSRIDREIRHSMAAEERNAENAQRLNTQTWNTYVQSFDEVAKEYSLQPKSAAYNFMKDSVRTQLANFIETQHDDGIDAAGLHDAVKRIMGAAAAAGLLSSSKKPSSGNGKSTPTTRPTLPPRRTPISTAQHTLPAPRQSTTPRPKPSEDPMDSADFIRKRAAAIFEAANRNAGKSRGLA